MLETGQSWQRRFAATPEQARHARVWVTSNVAHTDAALLAGELFIAIMDTRPPAIEMTVSTSGNRARIAASGSKALPAMSTHGPGSGIVHALATLYGTTPDDCGLWAEVTQESDVWARIDSRRGGS